MTKNKKRSRQIWVVLVGLMIVCLTVQAENRALLIGIGDYAINDSGMSATAGLQIPDLPGIDADLAMMKKIAHQMGYQENQIKVLQGKQAKLNNIRGAFQNWLISGIKDEDQVLIYFSGHGSRINDLSGDETEDQKDEVLLPYDFRAAQDSSPVALENVLLDDEFQQLLKKIPSRNVLVIIDACHSATATRGVQLSGKNVGSVNGVVKSVFNRDNPVLNAIQQGGLINTVANANYIALAASSDQEKSMATELGSLFTLGLYEAMSTAEKNTGKVTVEQLLSAAQKYVASNTGELQRYTPQLTGNQELAKKVIELMLPTAKPNSVSVPELDARPKNKVATATLLALKVSATQLQYSRGDYMQISVDIPYHGYLNIMEIGPDDIARLIFPNPRASDNQVNAGRFELPAKGASWGLTVNFPYGEMTYYTLLTSKNIEFNNNAHDVIDLNSRQRFFRVWNTVSEGRVSKGIKRVEGQVASGYLKLETCAQLLKNRRCRD